MWILATPVQFWVGYRFYIAAGKSLRNGFPDMNVLVALGTTAAYVYSVFAVIYGMIYSSFEGMCSLLFLFVFVIVFAFYYVYLYRFRLASSIGSLNIQ